MKERYGIGDHIPEIREEDIPKLARYADRKESPLSRSCPHGQQGAGTILLSSDGKGGLTYE